MKKLIPAAIFVLATAFTVMAGLEDVINSLKTGNAKELAKYIDDTIEISLPGKSDSYSRAQGTVVLQDFFDTNGVKGFEVKFKGENSGNEFCVGTLVCKAGSYRTTVFMKTSSGKQLVKEIRFQ